MTNKNHALAGQVAMRINGHLPGSLKYPKCKACKAAVRQGRHALLVNADHDESVKRWKEPHVLPEAF